MAASRYYRLCYTGPQQEIRDVTPNGTFFNQNF